MLVEKLSSLRKQKCRKYTAPWGIIIRILELEPPGWFPFALKDTGIPFYPVSFESDAFVLESSTIFYGHAGVAWEGLGTAVGVLHTVYFPNLIFEYVSTRVLVLNLVLNLVLVEILYGRL